MVKLIELQSEKAYKDYRMLNWVVRSVGRLASEFDNAHWTSRHLTSDSGGEFVIIECVQDMDLWPNLSGRPPMAFFRL